jgi:hypothetical protein
MLFCGKAYEARCNVRKNHPDTTKISKCQKNGRNSN